MAFKLAELFVEITGRTGPFKSSLAEVKGLASEAATHLGAMARNAALLGGALAAGAAVAGLTGAVRAASDLYETQSKVNTVFGESAKIVNAYADSMAMKFGIVKKESLEAAAQIGLIGKASGMSAEEAAKLGVEFAKLAADMSSFHNAPFEEALQKVRAGLVGEAEPLRVWGVLLSEDAVKAEALAKGIAKSAEEAKKLTDAQKVRARVSLIMGQTGDSQGDLERTANGYANLERKLVGSAQNLAAEVGSRRFPSRPRP